MRESENTIRWLASVIFCASLIQAFSAELPPPASQEVVFSRDIKPIFEASCIKCHGRGRDKGRFQLDSRETLLKGGDSGPSVIPGRSTDSYLIQLVAGTDPDNVMPQKGSRLTAEQVGLLRAWIDQGLRWEEGISFARKAATNLVPRKPTLPATATGLQMGHPIDAILAPYFGEHGIKASRPVGDGMFIRRVFLDILGVLPTPADIEEFQWDRRTDKRERLVERLLGDNQRYAEHWLRFWNDLLRNDYRGTGYIDGGRKQITRWLYSALATNMPYDRFVAELVNPTPESAGFTKGIIWRGVVNASQKPPMQAAQNISQVFMGVNLKCASCHDSFINDWTLADAYGLASVYADEPLEMVRCDKPTGKFASMRFLYPELGSIKPDAPKAERLQQLADLITQKGNGRLSRTIVNRLWAEFFGRGLVEPIDDMESPSWNPDLLDWLAEDLVENGYDLKATMNRILTSQAYQLPSVINSASVSDPYRFHGPQVRRLSAEQFRDALTSVTGVGFDFPVASIDSSLGQPSGDIESESLEQSPKAQWIWNDSRAAEAAPVETLYFRKRIFLREAPETASMVVTCDNRFELYINGEKAGSGEAFAQPEILDVRSKLRQGENIVAVSASNGKASKSEANSASENPAGFFFYARVRTENTIRARTQTDSETSSWSGADDLSPTIPVETVMDFVSDASWIWSKENADGWKNADFVPNGWTHAVELGDFGADPWKLDATLREAIATSALSGKIRASLVNADPLMTALGRPNREQLMTQRSSVATTLQGLELTNGETLSQILVRGAQHLIQDSPQSAAGLVDNVFLRALSRAPTKRERKLAESLVGSPVKPEGVEDLLWSVGMLPEFQLIY